MARLGISLLGHFEVTLDGQPLTCFRTDKTRALLAYLAVEADRAHRRATLAGLLWPDVPETVAHHSLSQSLYQLRQALGDRAAATPFLLSTGQTLRFNPSSDYTLDVAVFQAEGALCASPPEQLSPADAQALTRAVECYRGEFLSDPWLIDSWAFEEWLLLKQTQLHMQAVDALDYLVQYHEMRGEFALAADYARRQIALEPLREQAHQQLMRALALDGHRPEALAQYTACRALLAQELGIEPSAETTALVERIRAARTEALMPPAYKGKERIAARRASPPPFVGRTHELARLDSVLTSALVGQGQVVFITGEAGSGKTALLSAFARRALATHADVLVVQGSGNAYTGLADPYWPFVEMLRQLRDGAIDGAALHHLQARHLATARPAIARVLADRGLDLGRFLSGAGQVASGHRLEQAGLFEQIARALHAVASRHPLVLLLDDLQWADRDSLNLLFHLGRRLAGQRILIVGAFRPSILDEGYSSLTYLHEQDAGQRHPLAAVVNELQRQMGDIRIDLAQAEGQAFVDALLDSEPNHLGAEFRETFYRHTGGHALFAVELLREMQERGDLLRDANGYWVEGEGIAWQALPARVEAVIAERIGQLLPDWQAMLAVASVEGDEFTVEVLARVLDLAEPEVGRRLSDALSRHHHLVVPVGTQQVRERHLSRYRFRHLLFQKYLYNRLDAVEQAQLHRAVGSTLEALYGTRAAEISLSLARHFELGGEAGKAAVHLLHAGQRATHLAATEEAMRLLTRGLELLGRLEPSPEREQLEVELQLALGTALLPREESAPARAQALERAYELSRHAGTTAQLARSLLYLADVNLTRSQPDQIAAIGEQLLDLAQYTGNPLIAIFAHYALGAAVFFKGQLLLARPYLERVAASDQTDVLTTSGDANVGVRCLVWLGETLWALGYAEQAVEHSRRAISMARDLGHAFSLGCALGIGELTVRQHRREPAAMRAALQQLATLAKDADLSVVQLWSTAFQGWLAVIDDHDPAGLAQMRQAIDRWETVGTQGRRAYHYVLLVEACLALGQAESALRTAEQALADVAATSLRFSEAELWRLKGEALRALGQPAEAEGCFLRAIAVAQEQAARAWELRAVMSLCRLRQAEGTAAEFEAARQQLANLLAWFTEGLDTPDLQEAAVLMAGTGLTGSE